MTRCIAGLLGIYARGRLAVDDMLNRVSCTESKRRFKGLLNVVRVQRRFASDMRSDALPI